MALPASFLDELRGRTPLAPLIGRRVQLTRSGRQWKGLCPFHDEKSPSFYVYEDGFHCFGCGEHGDAITFVMRSDGASFPEAVARLAGEAGLEVPQPTPEAAAAEQRRLDLHGVLEAACLAFHRRLRGPEGEAALAYLRGRGLTEATIDAFALGWSGAGRGLESELGASAQMLADAGLTTEAADGRRRAQFFDRVMFPIRDAQGRVIGFGGRTLGDGQPKYLNGPETALFAKRKTLFGLDRARAVARTGSSVVVVEGYMDAIALHQAGFGGAVAPLGTALTEAQLEALWRLSPAPVLCFDGDAAGARAAERAIATALPHLAPDRTLALARLPSDQDPDSFVRSQGGKSFAKLLEAAQPLVDALFDMQRQGAASPEQLAGFRARLEAAARQIRHPALAAEYRRALIDRFFRERRQPPRQRGKPPPRPVPSLASADIDRCRLILCLLLNHPSVLRNEEETFGVLRLPEAWRPLQDAMLGWTLAAESLDPHALEDHLRAFDVEQDARSLLRARDLPQEIRRGAPASEALAAFWHYVGLLRLPLLKEELARAQQAFADRFDEVRQRRLKALCEARDRLYAADPAAT